jgi:hypothetical protein
VAVVQAEHVAADLAQRLLAPCVVGHLAHDLGTRLSRVGQEPWVVPCGAPEHHAIDAFQVTMDLRPRGDAAVDHDRQF